MIQTRNMKKNNITMNDIQTRDFHIKNYENNVKKCHMNVELFKINLAKEKINYIFNSFIREIDLMPTWGYVMPNYRFKTLNICESVRDFYPYALGHMLSPSAGWPAARSRDCPVSLIICRYENKRYTIKQELCKECQHCGDAW